MKTARIAVLLAVAAVPSMAGLGARDRARMAANEAAAIHALRTINDAQAVYAAECGDGRYARSLQDLGTTPPGGDRPYLSGPLGVWPTPLSDGYWFNIRQRPVDAHASSDCNGFATQGSYYAVAVPLRIGTTGERSFATSERGVIWQTEGPAPAAEPFGPPAVPVD